MAARCPQITLDCLDEDCYNLIGCVRSISFNETVPAEDRKKILEFLRSKKYDDNDEDSCLKCFTKSRFALEELYTQCLLDLGELTSDTK